MELSWLQALILSCIIIIYSFLKVKFTLAPLKDFLPLLYYRLPSDILLLIAEHAAVRKRHTYNLRGK